MGLVTTTSSGLSTRSRYLIAAIVIIIALHSLLSSIHPSYSSATSLSNLALFSSSTPTSASPQVPTNYYNVDMVDPSLRANATFVMLARNSDLDGAMKSVREAEDRFNRRYGYDWVFLNDQPFSSEFIRRMTNIVSGRAHFGTVPREHWVQPDWIDEERARAGRDAMVAENVIYGDSVSYRNMCRFNSGFFYRHELMLNYDWYWRVEPDVHFHCDVPYDPFVVMRDEKQVYGFTITMYEYRRTIETLWDAVKEFIQLHPEYVSENNAMAFLSDDGGSSYNLCHFWSNFEIASLSFLRSPAYTAFFSFLDSKGGFYYERWGDAPVHSIAAALFADKSQIRFFEEIGYEHNPYTHCPSPERMVSVEDGLGGVERTDIWTRGRCSCSPERSFDYDGYSCMRKWDDLMRS